MPRYLIELTHDDEHAACVRAIEAIEKYGAHFFTHADWGCKDGIHSAWVIADVDSREGAMQQVPPQFRPEARIVALNKFTREELFTLISEIE